MSEQEYRMFRVRDTRKPKLNSKYGTCYSYYDHFEVRWDNGEFLPYIIDLSYLGIYKDR